jgi:hypothetical protein
LSSLFCLTFVQGKKKLKSGESIFNVAAKNRFRDFEEGTKKLTKAFSFRDIPTSDEEPGLYCKYPVCIALFNILILYTLFYVNV